MPMRTPLADVAAGLLVATIIYYNFDLSNVAYQRASLVPFLLAS